MFAFGTDDKFYFVGTSYAADLFSKTYGLMIRYLRVVLTVEDQDGGDILVNAADRADEREYAERIVDIESHERVCGTRNAGFKFVRPVITGLVEITAHIAEIRGSELIDDGADIAGGPKGSAFKSRNALSKDGHEHELSSG